MDIDVLMKKGKGATAAYVHSECNRGGAETLLKLLTHFLDPLKPIDDWEGLEWLKRLISGCLGLEEFSETVRKYDTATTCGLVWTANFVAYRCRTCGISPCMSLCAECFKRGDHSGHDFNMFRSQAGGACDCGDTNVMKESGFCFLHGQVGQPSTSTAPPDLLTIAHIMMPRLILRLVIYMRLNSNSLSGFLGAIEQADGFISFLHEMSCMGAAMRGVLTGTLTNPQVYRNLIDENSDAEWMSRAKSAYEEALTSLPNPEPPEEYRDIPSLQPLLHHRTFLEEFVFWTAKFEFPQKIVCLLLNLLPDPDYKESFTRAFVLHYSRISQLLVHCQNPDMLSNRVVHVSVQLFSNEKLALKMTEEMKLLHVMVISLKYMMSRITIKSGTTHVVDCGHLVMKDHCYWPLVSDLNNILSHRPVALKFLEDDGLLSMWFDFLAMFQGMNVNRREMNQHIEFEPSTYYAAFSAELEASASPMWALVSHLKDETSAHLTKNLLTHCRSSLNKWLEEVGFDEPPSSISFHLPLHRYFSVFLYQAVKFQNQSLNSLLPLNEELLALIHHPLRVQTAFYEIISGLWVRNGLQIKGQAMTYVQCHFCNSMVDADLFLLQVAMVNLDAGRFLEAVFEKFHCLTPLSLSPNPPPPPPYLEPEQANLMLENCAIFLTTLASVRTSLGISDTDLITLEMVTLLCMGDKTHSQLMELIPERCGNSQSRDFEQVLEEVADYHAPNFESSGNMLQGMYVPKAQVWEKIYDPIYVLLRAVHRRDFQTSLDRFAEYTKTLSPPTPTPWPPFRPPPPPSAPYRDPRSVLSSRVLHGFCFAILYKGLNDAISDQLVALAVFLLEMALGVEGEVDEVEKVMATRELTFGKYDMNFSTWFNTDSLFANLRTEIDSIILEGTEEEMSMEMEVSSWEEPLAIAPGSSRQLAIEMGDSNDEMQIVVASEQSGQQAGQHPIHSSLLSLLLLLHSKSSSRPDSYDPSLPPSSSRVGPSSHFISNLLNKISSLDQPCKIYIQLTRQRLWPTRQLEPTQTNKSKAEERRAKLLAEMKEKQSKWMEKYGEEVQGEDEDGETFDCVICNYKCKSCAERPIGFVGLIQASSVVGRRWWGEPPSLPTQDDQRICNERSPESWEIGIVAQTCGHHIHYECLGGYLTALKSQQRQHNISIERGEYACPLCRQLANTFLPIIDPPPVESTCIEELLSMDHLRIDQTTPMAMAVKKCYEDMRNMATYYCPQSLEDFTINTARLNLELSGEEFLGKRSCIVPLLRVLSAHHPRIPNLNLKEHDPCYALVHVLLCLPIGTDIAHLNTLATHITTHPTNIFSNLLTQIINSIYTIPIPSWVKEQIKIPIPSQPMLLKLPELYDSIFQHYHRKACSKCGLVPKDPSVCLLCSAIVCMREQCCKVNNHCEGTSHSIECGAGTSVFLSVNSSTVVVVRAKRACLWGSVYLDGFGEEDRELKRGKPLYLCKERYDLLQQQWAQHRFDHTARKWIFHRDTL